MSLDAFVDDLEFAMRVVVLVIGAWNMAWSAKGAVRLAKGSYSPPSFYLAFVFFANFAFATFQVRWYFNVRLVYDDPQPIWALLLLSLSIVAGVLSMVGHYAGAALKAEQFYSLYGALPEALAIAELARHDPDAARRIAGDCWDRIARSVHQEIEQVYGESHEPG